MAERDLDVKLRVTKEGDPGAFKEAASDVKDLGEAAREASAPVDQVGGAFEATTSKIAKGLVVAQSVGAILSSVAEVAKRLGEAYGGLGEETEDVVDGLSDLGSAVSRLDGMAAAAALGRTLGAVYVDLTDATKGVARANEQLLDSMSSQVDRTRSVLAIQREFVESQKAKRQELDLTAEALARQGQVEQQAGQVSKALVEAVRETIRAYEEMGEAVPAALSEVAQQLGIGGDAAEAFAAKLGVSRKELDAQAGALAAFVKEFAASNAQLGDADFARLFGEQIQQILDGYASLRTAAPPAIQALAAAWGVSTSAAEKARDAQKAAIEAIVAEITGAPAKVGPPLEQLGQALAETLGKIDFDALDTAGLDRAKKVFEEFIERSRAAGQQVPRDIADQAAALGVLVPAMEVAGGSSSVFASKQQEAGSAAVELSEKIDATGKKSFELKQKFEEAGEAARTAGGKVKEGAEDFADAGTAGDEAARGIADAASAADALGKAAEQGGVDALAGSLGRLGAAVAPVKEQLESLNTLDLAGAAGSVRSIEAALDSVIAKASAAKAALDAIDAAGQ